MDDPFSALTDAVESVFHLVKPRNSGKYTYSEIQELKEAIENYQPDEKATFIELVKTLGAALPLFLKWGINFEPIKNSMNSLAAQHQMPAVDWDRYLVHSKTSPRFPFHNPQQDVDFVPWLNAMSEKTSMQQEPSLHSQLIAHREQLGFSQRLISHLDKDPEFLSRLIMESKENFIQISGTRLIFYLTDEQIAEAIIQYLPELLPEHPNPFDQVEQLVDRLNGILSNGRSISTLLRNSKAKETLDGSEFFQIYQSEEYKNRQEQPSFVEDEYSKPQI
ncbi:hypothetical protein LEAN103870_09410 [Legionella anisa]|uniref:Uncharacterized protein n=1 Tax=Legionella anisa TaxID=28082 RepID=A0AAX0WXM5_9GAMM|nr:hypothetical protein [Legionella anisa]AWN73283.1 hypothetical protein DLD14_05185 [Legionella anisa]KTC69905.1 hypothetical protein Lani_2611 [Legionella anisa]MBN5936686.1 hypothetical protein [Legionella anisa]MCW8423054.1 hypothetical protein [Legionella anisa]MCW8447803.1 hypothetical protein [Legionella anisa]